MLTSSITKLSKLFYNEPLGIKLVHFFLLEEYIFNIMNT